MENALMLDGLDELGRERFEEKERFDPRKRFVASIPEHGPVIISCRVKDYADIGSQVGLVGAVTLKGLSDLQIREYLAGVPALWQTIQTDQDLRDLVRTPLLLAILARAYRDNPSELSALSDLKAARRELREKIFDAYVRSRFAHEERHGHTELPFSIDEAYRYLGEVVIDGVEYREAGLTESGTTPEESIRHRLGAQAVSFVEQMARLHLLVRAPGNTLRFIHRLFRDYCGFRYALAFVKSPEFRQSSGFKDRQYEFRMRTLQFLAESGDERALEPLLEHVEPYVDFPLVYSLSLADPRVLLAFARSLLVDQGLAKYDYVSDAAREQIKVVSEKLGPSTSAQVLASAIRSAHIDERAAFVFALGYLELAEGLDAVVSSTQDGDATVRGCAVYALAAIGRPETAGAVERLLDDEDVVSSWNAAPWRSGTRVKQITNAALLRSQ